MKLKYSGLILTMLMFNLTSCMHILGTRNNVVLSDTKIIRLSKRFNIPEDCTYKIDSQSYQKCVKKYNLNSIQERSNLQQPNQILVFNQNGKSITSLINCNIGGFPYLKWNRYGGLDSIPIRQGMFSTSSHFSKEEIESFSVPLNQSTLNGLQNNTDFKYVYSIFWSRILFRNSKKMIKLINRNLKLAKKQGVEIDVRFIYSDSKGY